MKVIEKQHLHVLGWLLVNTRLATVVGMLRMNDSVLLFMGKFLWLNKLRMEILHNIRKIYAICHNFPFVEVGMA
jgi:hypothetical protein